MAAPAAVVPPVIVSARILTNVVLVLSTCTTTAVTERSLTCHKTGDLPHTTGSVMASDIDNQWRHQNEQGGACRLLGHDV